MGDPICSGIVESDLQLSGSCTDPCYKSTAHTLASRETRVISPSIGLLPLYLALYDEMAPALRGSVEAFRHHVVATLSQAGLQVCDAPICRVREECRAAVAMFEDADVDLIVTLHLAYSPSLEAIDSLGTTKLPLLLLDTTPDAAFDQQADPALIMTNHGIHGVQDLSTMLRRHKKAYQVAAGHLSDPRMLARTTAIARAALAARRFSHTRALRIGPVFAGMGDFQLAPEAFTQLGIHIDEVGIDALADAVLQVTDEQIAEEMATNQERFVVDAFHETHRRSARLALGVRAYLEQGGYTAWSMNFGSFDRAEGPVDTVPFLETCLSMARGLGYAGEGDLLTAALVGALQSAFGRTTFTEMFCPDWRGGTIFLSHMGEANPEVAANRPRLYEKDYPFSPTNNPACLAFALQPGAATLVNLAPGPDDAFRLICAPVEVLEDSAQPAFDTWMRGWIRPSLPLPEFLEAYAYRGGTHHSALMLGDHRDALAAFAQWLGFEYCPIG